MTKAWQILTGLAAGLVLGAVWDWAAWPALASVVAGAEAIGGLWLDALKMTIVPLVFALIVTGIISTTNAAAAGRITGRSILLFAILLTAGAAFSALVTPPLLALWPIPEQAERRRVTAEQLWSQIEPLREKLHSARARRERPKSPSGRTSRTTTITAKASVPRSATPR